MRTSKQVGPPHLFPTRRLKAYAENDVLNAAVAPSISARLPFCQIDGRLDPGATDPSCESKQVTRIFIGLCATRNTQSGQAKAGMTSAWKS